MITGVEGNGSLPKLWQIQGEETWGSLLPEQLPGPVGPPESLRRERCGGGWSRHGALGGTYIVPSERPHRSVGHLEPFTEELRDLDTAAYPVDHLRGPCVLAGPDPSSSDGLGLLDGEPSTFTHHGQEAVVGLLKLTIEPLAFFLVGRSG